MIKVVTLCLFALITVSTLSCRKTERMDPDKIRRKPHRLLRVDEVRVYTHDGKRIRGKAVRVEETSVTLQVAGDALIHIPMDDILIVRYRRPTQFAKIMLGIGKVLAGVVLAAWLLVDWWLDEDDDNDAQREIRRDLRRHQRGEPLRYHKDIEELRRRQRQLGGC